MTKIPLFSLVFVLVGFVFTTNTYAESAYNPDAIATPTVVTPTVVTPTVVTPTVVTPTMIAPDDKLSSTAVGMDYPDPVIYKVEYADNSPLKNVDLSKAVFQLQVFAEGSPYGIKPVTPTVNNKIVLSNPKNFRLAIMVRSISFDDKALKDLKCRGFVNYKKNVIKVSCKK